MSRLKTAFLLIAILALYGVVGKMDHDLEVAIAADRWSTPHEQHADSDFDNRLAAGWADGGHIVRAVSNGAER